MSPLVQQKRVLVRHRQNASTSGTTRASMLLFAGFSGGVLALVAAFGALLALVGVYVIVVWPLTFWDLANLHLEKYTSWTPTIVASVFATGSLVGLCYFGRAESRPKEKTTASARPAARFRK